MKSNQLLAGTILTAFGIYFLSREFNITIPYSHILFSWPTVLVLTGLVLSWQGFSNRNDSSMFSGTVVLGLGVLFHGIYTFQYWSYQWPYFTLIIAAAFLMKHFITKREGASAGIILLLISLAALFFSTVVEWLNSLHASMEMVWPFILVAAGVYLLFFRK